MNAEHVLTIGIAYEPVRGGVAAVEKTYSTFYKPFNHIATVVADGKFRKFFVAIKGIVQFLWWMIFHPEIRIVHVHGASDASFWRKRIFIKIAKRFGRKVIFHCHGAEFKRFASGHIQEVCETLGRCDCVIALSESWRNWFQTDLGCKNVVVIKNVIPEPCIEHKAHSDAKQLNLLFLGRLGERKGIYDLLNVLAELKKDGCHNIKLRFGGDGEIEKVNQYIHDNKLEDMTEYLGWVNGEKKIEALNQADVYVLPSYNEGLPISVLEAMSYHLPIISTTVGGIPEILVNGENGFIFNPGDRQALYMAIKQFLQNPLLCSSMGERSAVFVKQHLPKQVMSQLESLYNSL